MKEKIIIDTRAVSEILGVSQETARRMSEAAKPGEALYPLPSSGKKMWYLSTIVKYAKLENERQYLERKNSISRAALEIERVA